MEHEYIIPCSKEPPLIPLLSQMNSVHTHTLATYLRPEFNTILPSTTSSSKCSSSLQVSRPKLRTHFSHLPDRSMSRHSHPP